MKRTRAQLETRLRRDFGGPVDDPVAVAAHYLGFKYGDADSYEEVEAGIRSTASWNNLPHQRDAEALRLVLAMGDDEVDMIHLVGWVANQGLPQHTVEASRAWLQEQLELLERVLADYPLDTIEGFIDKYEKRYGFVDEAD
jgi:hypothetical protein